MGGRGSGRKKKAVEECLSCNFAFIIEGSVADLVRDEAAKQGLSFSDLARKVIQEYIDNDVFQAPAEDKPINSGVRLTPKEDQKLRQYAKDHHVDVATIVKDALRRQAHYYFYGEGVPYAK